MRPIVLQLKKRLSAEDLRIAQASAKKQGLTLEEWLERAVKAAIYADANIRLIDRHTA